MALLRDRAEAGRELAQHLAGYADNPNVVVLALPRGGVPVGYEVAHALHLPLDVYVVRKIGVPGHEELAMGAIASDGTFVVDEETLVVARVDRAAFEDALAREAAELYRRSRLYRDARPERPLENRTLIIVDDGLATGASMYAAVRALRERNPAEAIVAVPVAPIDTCNWLERVGLHVLCPHRLGHFGAVGLHYENFLEISDDEVRELLARAAQEAIAYPSGV